MQGGRLESDDEDVMVLRFKVLRRSQVLILPMISPENMLLMYRMPQKKPDT